MTWGAYVFGDLSWPMPDLGMVAVWRAMPIDASRWGDWDGFVEDVNPGTIAEMFDRLGMSSSAAFKLDLDENGAKLRAYLEDADADCWRRLAIAWRAAADLGASGEFVWVPGRKCPVEVAYHGVIGDYDSRWEKCDTNAVEQLAGRKEIDAMMPAPAGPDDGAEADDDEDDDEDEDDNRDDAIPAPVRERKSAPVTKTGPTKRAPTKRATTKKPVAKKPAKKSAKKR